jgi:hypothetical protein
MTTHPFAGVISPTTFDPATSYDIRIDTNGDGKADQTYKFTFDEPDTDAIQEIIVRCVPARRCAGDGGAVIARGVTGENIPLRGGGMARADRFDDPFFFDLVAFSNNLTFCRTPVNNFFRGANVLGIVIEQPISAFGTSFGIWARTEKNGVQVDRIGKPVTSGFFIPGPRKDAFNAGQPKRDWRAYSDDVIGKLLQNGYDTTTATTLAGTILPDILTFNIARSGGFPNGRRLDDDVMDRQLSLLTNGAITTDCVGNDSSFNSTFPYLAPPNGMTTPGP